MTDTPNTPDTPELSLQARKPRILWANLFCLLDTANGASMSVREMLRQLVSRGHDVHVLGATIFDAERGTYRLREHWQTITDNPHDVVKVVDGPLTHHLMTTASINRNAMTAVEEGTWFELYLRTLDDFKPDIVYFYGGLTLDLLISAEARARGIPAVAYLANGSYKGTRWCRDIDLILTNSHATATLYQQTQGFTSTPLGCFIDPAPVVATTHSRKHLLFVNPLLEKGAGIVIQLAILLEKRRPDIIFEVVESRGRWQALLERISSGLGKPRATLNNVIVTPNTDDMRPLYGRARILLAPSLWWESSGRVLVEAMLNSIPAIISDRGGMPEMIDNAGVKIQFPDKCYEKPYTHLPNNALLEPLVACIEKFYDDEAFYQQYVERARQVGQTRHGIAPSTDRLINALMPLLALRAGDQAHGEQIKRLHRHRQAV